MILIIILVVVLLIVIWCISTVNGFKKKEIRVQEGLSGVEVALTKRYDMLTKMLDTAKGYMAHENELFAMFPAKLLAGTRQPKEFFVADAGKREDMRMTF